MNSAMGKYVEKLVEKLKLEMSLLLFVKSDSAICKTFQMFNYTHLMVEIKMGSIFTRVSAVRLNLKVDITMTLLGELSEAIIWALNYRSSS
jgi:hypothetical protein